MINALATLAGLLSLATAGVAQNGTKPVYAHFMVSVLPYTVTGGLSVTWWRRLAGRYC